MPGLLDRLMLATRALTGAYEGTGAGPGDFLRGVFPGAVGAPPVRGTQQQLEAYSSTPWTRAVVEKIASAFASVEWKLYVKRTPKVGVIPRKIVRDTALQQAGWMTRSALITKALRTDELQPIEAHPFLDQIMNAGNPFHTGLAMRKITAIHFETAGEFFWLKERNGLGMPTGVWPIPPHWILNRPTPTARMFRVSYRGWQAWIPDTEMLWVTNPDPVNPYGAGSGMVRVLGDEIESDEYAAKLTKQLFFNQARPDLIVMPADEKAQMGDAERLRFERSWLDKLQGYFRQYKPLFLSRQVKITEVDRDFRGLQFAQLRQYIQDTILQAWGLPPEMIGKTENSNRATSSAAEYLFTRWVLVPRLEFFRSAMQEQFLPEFDERLILDYVSPVQADEAQQLAVAQAAPWSLEMDEFRGMMGFPPKADGAGRVHLVPITLTPQTFGEEVNPMTLSLRARARQRAATPADRAWLEAQWARERERVS